MSHCCAVDMSHCDGVSTYEALGSIVHQAQLEALLVLEGFSQSVPQAVGGKHALPALLKLAEYTLRKINKYNDHCLNSPWLPRLGLC